MFTRTHTKQQETLTTTHVVAGGIPTALEARNLALGAGGVCGANLGREDASSMVTAGATANITVKNSRASRESGLLCSHSHGESIEGLLTPF